MGEKLRQRKKQRAVVALKDDCHGGIELGKYLSACPTGVTGRF
jgi:hypothetical protein